jgi:hypothetical protein
MGDIEDRIARLALLRGIEAHLRDLVDALNLFHKDIDVYLKSAKSAAESSEGKPPTAPIRVIVDPALPHKPTLFDRIKIYIEVLTLLVVGLYTYVATQQWFEMRKTTEASIEAARAAGSAIRIGQANFKRDKRPWVGLNEAVQPVGTPTFHFGAGNYNYVGMNLNVSYKLRNFGNSPAFHERSTALYVTPTTAGNKPTSQEIQPWMTLACASNAGGRWAIFPGAEAVEQSGGNVSFRTADATEIRRVWIVGCITYEDSFGTVYHTKFLARSVFPDGSQWIRPDLGHSLRYLPIVGFEMWEMEAD